MKKERLLPNGMVLMILVSLFLFSNISSGLTVPEIQQIITESKKQVHSGHFIFQFDMINSEISKAYDTPHIDMETRKKLKDAVQEICTKEEIIIDNDSKSMKEISSDLRDIPSLAKKYNLPLDQYINLCQSKIMLFQKGYQARFYHPEGKYSKPVMMVDYNDKGYHSISNWDNLMILGLNYDDFLSIYKEFTITTIKDNKDNELLQLVMERKKKGHIVKVIIDCDPSLGYRYRNITKLYDGELSLEYIATDYRLINNIPYPFTYIEKYYNPLDKGKLIKKYEYKFTKVELNQKYSKKDFNFMVPTGIRIHDLVLNRDDEETESNMNFDLEEYVNNKVSKKAEAEILKKDFITPTTNPK